MNPPKTRARTGLALAALAAIPLIASSCAMRVLTPYYRPAAPGGTVQRGIQPRTESVMTFQREGVVVGVCSNFLVDRVDAVISFEVPDHKEVQLLEHHLQVSDSTGKAWTNELTGRSWTSPGRTAEIPLDASMVGGSDAWRLGTAKGLGDTKFAAFFFTAPLFERPGPVSFTIKPPRFQINEVEVELPQINFTFDEEMLWTSRM